MLVETSLVSPSHVLRTTSPASSQSQPSPWMDWYTSSLPFEYVFVLNLEGHFLFCNDGVQRLGFQEGFASGRSLLDEASAQALEGMVQGVMQSQQRGHCRQWVNIRHHDQNNDDDLKARSALWDVTLFPIRDNNQQMVALGGLIDEEEGQEEQGHRNRKAGAEEEAQELQELSGSVVEEAELLQTSPGAQPEDKDMTMREASNVSSQISSSVQSSEADGANHDDKTGSEAPEYPCHHHDDAAVPNHHHHLILQDAVRESEERHQTLFENMTQGVVYHAADGSTMAANQSALRILGLTMDQMLGKTPMDPQWKFIYEDGSTIPVQEYPAVVALSGKPVTGMILGVYGGGGTETNVRWAQLDAMPRFRPGEAKPYQAYTIFTDITQAKQIEKSLLRAKEKAEEADHLKSAFLATMSHEIRTPLNGIMGHLDLILSNGLTNESREENLEGLQVAMNSGKLLLCIIEDILDLSKCEAGQLDIVTKPMPVREMMDNTMKLANAYRIQRKKDQVLRLEQSIDKGIVDRIYGDQFRVQQVLNNLLSNSIKFSTKGEVSVSVQLCSDKNMVEFCVRDNGKGIPEDRLEMIFEPFRQVDFSDTRTHGGTGLGLTICKKLIEIMGGNMWVTSSTKPESHGSQFYFTLPYKPATAEEAAAADANNNKRKSVQSTATAIAVPERPPLRCQRSGMILLAEDDMVSRKVATRMLQKAGLKVLPARDGAEAVELFEKHQQEISLVLMDVMMPKLSGLEATERIRALETKLKSPETVPICALSAGAMKGDKEKGLEVGMNDYLYKPINRSQLMKTLETYLGKHEHTETQPPTRPWRGEVLSTAMGF